MLALIAVTVVLSQTIYTWTDKKGVVHYTDTLTGIPSDAKVEETEGGALSVLEAQPLVEVPDPPAPPPRPVATQAPSPAQVVAVKEKEKDDDCDGPRYVPGAWPGAGLYRPWNQHLPPQPPVVTAPAPAPAPAPVVAPKPRPKPSKSAMGGVSGR